MPGAPLPPPFSSSTRALCAPSRATIAALGLVLEETRPPSLSDGRRERAMRGRAACEICGGAHSKGTKKEYSPEFSLFANPQKNKRPRASVSEVQDVQAFRCRSYSSGVSAEQKQRWRCQPPTLFERAVSFLPIDDGRPRGLARGARSLRAPEIAPARHAPSVRATRGPAVPPLAVHTSYGCLPLTLQPFARSNGPSRA